MKKEDEKLLNGLDMISGYISNEINLGKSKEEIVESLTNKMNISEEIAINLVYKNNNILKIMEYHKTDTTAYLSKCIGGGTGYHGTCIINNCIFTSENDTNDKIR